LSERLRAWYILLGLGLLTLGLLAIPGHVPASLSSAVAGPQRLVYTVSVNLRTFVASGRDRRELHAEVAQLTDALARSRTRVRALELETARYAQMLELRTVQSPGVVLSAPVVSTDLSTAQSSLELGLGRAGGVTRDMPVTVPDGLVGLVTRVSPRSAWVRTILDPASSVGVSVRGRGGQGIAVGDVSGLVRVTSYAEAQPINVGDTLETNSRGGLFPRGIVVGEVIRVEPKAPNDLRRTFWVRPTADLGTLLEVALIRPL
jgi:rod shape-determining protein MreC